MRIHLHIGPDRVAAARLQRILGVKRERLRAEGILFPRSPGAHNHTRLFMAVSDPETPDSLRANRGLAAPEAQDMLRREVVRALADEIAQADPKAVILSAWQLGACLPRQSELERLKAMLQPISSDIRIVAHMGDPAGMALRHYEATIMEGRAAPLSDELALCSAEDWWQGCLEAAPAAAPGVFADVQALPFWLDRARLAAHWEEAFGAGSVALRPLDMAALFSAEGTAEAAAAFDLPGPPGKAEPEALPEPPSATTLARARQLNALLLRFQARKGRALPRQTWRRLLAEMAVDGPRTDPATLAPLNARFGGPKRDAPGWQEAEPGPGFRASQYLLAFLPRIEKAMRQEPAAPAPVITANPALPPLAQQKLAELAASPFRPDNRFGRADDAEPRPPYTAAAHPPLPEGSSGKVIVACMKNEAPYIVEWVAHHRAIGIHDFVIYSNGCDDGTDAILDRLDAMGVLHHRRNDDWKGNSPQQHALNASLSEPAVRDADWLIHIDVDEFINVRCGNGTLDDFLSQVPDATNVAMTWRLFGHDGEARLSDVPVTERFTACAPSYCPKPHTVWGFKTMFRNVGAYEKMSCHRPNKLRQGFEDRVKWVNGSGRPMGGNVARNGWRSSRASIGYDLLQLNHYALRSAESFLVKRQRGRALHVDRMIGLNYWIRMDWCDHRDLSIQRNLPRLRAGIKDLMADPVLADLVAKGREWHRAKADELHRIPEFADLYRQALALRLTGTERAAYALALDVES